MLRAVPHRSLPLRRPNVFPAGQSGAPYSLLNIRRRAYYPSRKRDGIILLMFNRGAPNVSGRLSLSRSPLEPPGALRAAVPRAPCRSCPRIAPGLPSRRRIQPGRRSDLRPLRLAGACGRSGQVLALSRDPPTHAPRNLPGLRPVKIRLRSLEFAFYKAKPRKNAIFRPKGRKMNDLAQILFDLLCNSDLHL